MFSCLSQVFNLFHPGSWSDVDYTKGCDSNAANWKAAVHHDRILIMTKAWYIVPYLFSSSPNRLLYLFHMFRYVSTSFMHNNATLLEAIQDALDYWFDNDYYDIDCDLK